MAQVAEESGQEHKIGMANAGVTFGERAIRVGETHLLLQSRPLRHLAPARDRVEIIVQEHCGDIVSARMFLQRAPEVATVTSAHTDYLDWSRRTLAEGARDLLADNFQPRLKAWRSLVTGVPMVPIDGIHVRCGRSVPSRTPPAFACRIENLHLHAPAGQGRTLSSRQRGA